MVVADFGVEVIGHVRAVRPVSNVVIPDKLKGVLHQFWVMGKMEREGKVGFEITAFILLSIWEVRADYPWQVYK